MVLEKIIDKFDNSLLSISNSATYAWNYTTGCTRADLANLCNVAGAVAIGSQTLSEVNPILNFMGISTLFLVGREFYTNHKTDNLEADLASKGLKSEVIENNKNRSKFWGLAYLGMGCLFAIPDGETAPFGFSDTADTIVGAGFAAQGIHHYVMRSNYLPPSKSLPERGFDKLKDYFAKPLVPIPIK